MTQSSGSLSSVEREIRSVETSEEVMNKLIKQAREGPADEFVLIRTLTYTRDLLRPGEGATVGEEGFVMLQLQKEQNFIALRNGVEYLRCINNFGEGIDVELGKPELREVSFARIITEND